MILLDLSLPRVDGFQVLTKLQKENFKTPIVIMSNLTQPTDIARAKSLGAVDYFIKTDVTPEQLVNEIEKRLNYE